MSGQRYEFGTVASIATSAERGRVVAIRSDSTGPGCPSWQTGHGYVLDSAVTDVRPLIVLDPERWDIPATVAMLRYHALNLPQSPLETDLLGEMADQVEAQIPKPDEPTGLGAVVEDAKGKRWLRVSGDLGVKAPWHDGIAHTTLVAYDDITAVRVVSEGVQP